ncbi:hypothetical protein CKO15_12920 [Halorhodospira abdelmalekii]|uniref:ParB/RepB/Spo0J family partition protein n=1 Tax=Halorhodospira abdelmalekii TaxID=421629 RepID=UPI001906F363|nr:ParB/RepB/Spo0J family partition protein [Halorhodospira abdelmalekii]MBK1736157.1 hypothetical protein [Halorhodospira abdelmalekii]
MPSKKQHRGLRALPPAEAPQEVFHGETLEFVQASTTRPPASASLDRAEQGLRDRAYQEIPIEQIELVGKNRFPASYDPDTEALLREDIASRGHNEIPAAVRHHPNPSPDGPKYQLIYGHRRYFACRDLGLPLRAYVREASDAQLISDRLRENSNRQNQPPYETAILMAEALELEAVKNRAELAALTGTSKATITKMLALVDLPKAILEIVGERPSWIPLRLGYEIATESNKNPDLSQKITERIFKNAGPACDAEEAKTRLTEVLKALRSSNNNKKAHSPNEDQSSKKGEEINAVDKPTNDDDYMRPPSYNHCKEEDSKTLNPTRNKVPQTESPSHRKPSGQYVIQLNGQNGEQRGVAYLNEHGKIVIEPNFMIDVDVMQKICKAIERAI